MGVISGLSSWKTIIKALEFESCHRDNSERLKVVQRSFNNIEHALYATKHCFVGVPTSQTREGGVRINQRVRVLYLVQWKRTRPCALAPLPLARRHPAGLGLQVTGSRQRPTGRPQSLPVRPLPGGQGGTLRRLRGELRLYMLE